MFSHYFKDELWDVFHSVIFELITEFLPTKTVRICNGGRFQYPILIKKLLTRKKTVWRNYRRFKTFELKSK